MYMNERMMLGVNIDGMLLFEATQIIVELNTLHALNSIRT